MTKASFFENSDLLWPVLAVSTLLWLVFAWKEWKRPVPKRFYLHIFIALITIVSLAMLVIKPFTEKSNETKAGVLLTERFSQERLDSIEGLHKEIEVISYSPNKPITETLDSLSTIYVLGDGVASYDFWQFKNRSVRFLGSDVPTGIIRLKYTKKNVLGEDLVITGSYHRAKAKHRLVLQDGNGFGIDSVVLNTSDSQNFKLKTPIKAIGKFVFKILEKDSLGEQVSSDPLPFKVIENKNLKVLLINGFPTFETKYLKNYLAEMGHEVVVRSQLTKGRYKFEYFNTLKAPVYTLNQGVMSSFDLLIIDAISFNNISQRSRASLDKAIKNDGLGVFIQPEPNLFNMSSKQLGLSFKRDGRSKTILDEFPKKTFEKFSYVLLEDNGLEKIHSSASEIFTGYKRMQKGRVGATVFQNTYQLQLNGNSKAFRQFWSKIVNKLSKKNNQLVSWQTADNFTLEHQPFKFELQTEIASPRVYNQEKNTIALRQDIDLPTGWSGITYPLRQKWNQLQLGESGENILDFYVIDSLAWTSLRTSNLRKENKRYFENPSENQVIRTSVIAINSLWFFVIGLLGLGYLWLHPKLWK